MVGEMMMAISMILVLCKGYGDTMHLNASRIPEEGSGAVPHEAGETTHAACSAS